MIALHLVHGDTTTAPGRTVPPALYYRFEDAARPGADTMGHHDLLPTAASTLPLPAPTPGGAVGAFAAFDGGNTSEALAAGAGAWNCSASSCDGVTVEFLLRAGPNFNKAGETPVLQSRGEGSAFAFEALLARHGYGLHAGGSAYGFPQQLNAGADVLAPLEGVGRAAHGWLLDGGWHHVAMRKRAHPANASECVADIWLDGQSPAGFSSTGPAVGAVCTFSTGEPLVLLPAAFGGDIDEVAVWTTALTDTHIAAHAAGALRTGGGVPYCYTDPGGAAPPADPTDGPFDLREFAPGTQLPTPPDSPNGTRGVALTCLQQLQAFPPPRYAANNSGGRAAALPPLSNCMDPDYMAGENQPGCKKDAMINGSLAVQAELAAHWSYALFAGNVNKAAVVGALHPTYAEQAEGFVRLLQLANAHPEWPFEAEIIRANVINVTAPKGPHNKPAIVSQFLPAACYLQDASGTFIDYSGATVLPGKYGILNICFKYLRQTVKMVGIGEKDILDSDAKLVLGMVWSIIVSCGSSHNRVLVVRAVLGASDNDDHLQFITQELHSLSTSVRLQEGRHKHKTKQRRGGGGGSAHNRAIEGLHRIFVVRNRGAAQIKRVHLVNRTTRVPHAADAIGGVIDLAGLPLQAKNDEPDARCVQANVLVPLEEHGLETGL
jgi:hypothetical protein